MFQTSYDATHLEGVAASPSASCRPAAAHAAPGRVPYQVLGRCADTGSSASCAVSGEKVSASAAATAGSLKERAVMGECRGRRGGAGGDELGRGCKVDGKMAGGRGKVTGAPLGKVDTGIKKS